jgi:hypothetical protein
LLQNLVGRAPQSTHPFLVDLEACCKRMFRVFQMFQRYVLSVFSRRMLQACLSGCCICFTHTLHVFYLNVAYDCNGFKCFYVFFSIVSEVCFKCFNCLQRMLQLLYLNVSKVDQVLHLFSPPSVAWSLPAPAGHPYDVVAGSFQIRGATRPAPLVARASATPCEE